MATRKKARKTKKKTKARAKPKKKVKAKKKAKPKKKAKAKPKKKAKAKPKKKAKPKPKKKAKAKPKKKAVPKKKAAAAKKARVRPVPKDLGDFSLESKLQRQKDVAWRMIDGEAVIITPADSTMHTLNDVGTRIWELLTGTRSLREVAGVLCTEFEVDKDRAEKDTLWFAECLSKKGLIEYP
jgi:hypothetical protein